MKKTLTVVAVVVSVLTLVSLVIDLPTKLDQAYRKVTGYPPKITVKALFLNQDSFYVSHFKINDGNAYGYFVWPSIFELNNVSSKDVTIREITNIFPTVTSNDHVITLPQVKKKHQFVQIYGNFEQVTEKHSSGISEHLPYTVKSGTKLYVKVYSRYSAQDHGRLVPCKNKKLCYRRLAGALGVFWKKDGARPCILKKFHTRVSFMNYKSKTTRQTAIILIPGCKLDIDKLLRDSGLEGFQNTQ